MNEKIALQDRHGKIIEIERKYIKELILDQSRKVIDETRLEAVRSHENGRAVFVHFPEIFSGVSSVLDIGCGNGEMLLLMSEFKNIRKLAGIDIFPQHIEIAEHFNNGWIQFLLGDITNLETLPELSTQEFDVITTFHTLEHIFPEDFGAVMYNIRSLLKLNGYLLISLPYEHAHDSGQHQMFFDENTLSTAIESCGFQTLKCFRDTNSALTGMWRKK